MTASRLTLVAAAVVAVVYVATMKRPWGAPSVPLAVSATLAHFAPGLAIGTSVEENAKQLRSAHWSPQVGYTGALLANRGFTHARLLVEPRRIGNATGDMDARVHAIELIASRSDSIPGVMFDLGIAFRSSPKDGCILPGVDGIMAPRRVQYWATRSDEGGVALITDWLVGRDVKPSQVVVWSLFAWAGPFEGGKTLFANFDPRSCLAFGETFPLGTPDVRSTAAERDQAALRDSLAGANQAVVAQAAAAETPLVGGDAPDACSIGVQKPAETRATTLFEIDLPGDFTLKNRAAAEQSAQATGYARYEWTASDGSTFAVFADGPSQSHRGWTGAISSECDIESISGPMHIDIANASVARPDRVVHAALAVPGHLSLTVLGHARSIERQQELVRAARSVRVSPRWGSR